MHLGNGAITPECAAVTLGAAAIGLGAATWSLRHEPISRQKLALAAGLGAMVFAAQAVNVPILPGSSAHLVGGVLLAWALGPGLGAWMMTLILVVQALAMGDGGTMALGANVLNMALLPAGIVALGKRAKIAEGRWSQAWAGILAACSVPIAALLIALQTALFRSSGELAGWSEFAVRMIGVHLLVGIAEGGLTVVLLAAIAGWKATPALQSNWRPAVVSLCLAGLLGVASFWSSPLPDTYESSAEQSRMGWLLGDEPAESH
jgi:cobalt/nickel transport system permease protein